MLNTVKHVNDQRIFNDTRGDVNLYLKRLTSD